MILRDSGAVRVASCFSGRQILDSDYWRFWTSDMWRFLSADYCLDHRVDKVLGRESPDYSAFTGHSFGYLQRGADSRLKRASGTTSGYTYHHRDNKVPRVSG